MRDEDFTAEIRDQAGHIADFLGTLTPFQRALVWHLAEESWQEHEEQRRGMAAKTQDDFQEALLDLECFALVDRFRVLSPESREAVRDLARDLGQLERLDAMVDHPTGKAGEDEARSC